MKVLGNISVNKDNNANYPFGSNIQNETDVLPGTPVIREIYGDVLMNIYKLLELANITPTDTEDNDSTQYQLIEALKKLPNSLNDIEQVLDLSGSVWSVPFDLSILPNKYFFIARAGDGYASGASYTFKGTGALELPFTSVGFSASDELLVIIDSLSVRAYSLNALNAGPDFLATIISTPVRYNSGNDLYYFNSGKLYKNNPLAVYDLQNSIRVDQSDGALILQSVNMMQGYVVCVVKNPATVNYEFYAFDLLDLNTVIPVSTDIVQTPSTDYLPEFYASDAYLYVSNLCNTDALDYKFTELTFDANAFTLNESTNLSFDASFVKTPNGAIYSDNLYTLISGELNYFNVNTGAITNVGVFNALDGYLFLLGSNLYLNQTNIAHKLVL